LGQSGERGRGGEVTGWQFLKKHKQKTREPQGTGWVYPPSLPTRETPEPTHLAR
jgi:hypothetical protein